MHIPVASSFQERNYEDLNVLYQQQISENIKLQFENDLKDEMIKKNEEKIENLTKKNVKLSEKVSKLT